MVEEKTITISVRKCIIFLAIIDVVFMIYLKIIRPLPIGMLLEDKYNWNPFIDSYTWQFNWKYFLGSALLCIPLGCCLKQNVSGQYYRWAIAVLFSLMLEFLQTILHKGVFDIATVLFMILGFVIGSALVSKTWFHNGKAKAS